MKSSASMWIWIIGGILVGTIVFTVAYSQLMATSMKISEQRVLEQYGELGNRIDDLCWSFVGNKRSYTIVLNMETQLVYLSKSEGWAPSNITELVRENDKSEGDKLCVLLKGSRPRCNDLECNATMTYIGSLPPKESLLAMVKQMAGSKPKYEYKLQLSKEDRNVKVRKISEIVSKTSSK